MSPVSKNEAIQSQNQQLHVGSKHMSEREKLVQELTKYAISNNIIKTFYIVTESGEKSILGMYCFNGVVYEECEEDIRAKLYEYVEPYPEIDAKLTSRVMDEIIKRIRESTLTELKYEPLTIAFENVLFDWQKFLDTGNIREAAIPPNPDIITFHHIPHKLRIDILDQMPGLLKFNGTLVTNLEEIAQKLCPTTLKVFKDWVDDKWPILFEIIGYTLYPRYDLYKVIMIFGEGSNGKSTYLRLVRDILGEWNVVAIPLHELTTKSNRFVIAPLYHKLANISFLPSELKISIDRFKVLTGEGKITADRKFKGSITFVNYAKLIFSTDVLPQVKVVNDNDDSFWRRWIVIQFPHQFPIDPTFYERIFTEQEIEGVILVSLFAFRNVWIRKQFSVVEMTSSKYNGLIEQNNVYSFILDLRNGKIEGYKAECCEDCRVDSKTLYSLYVKWCDSEGRTPLPKRQFTIYMEKLGFRRVLIHGAPYFKGIKLIEDHK